MSPTVAVNFMTYSPEEGHPRVQYAQRCLLALLDKLKYSKGELIWHIADDGSFPGHVDALVEICRARGVEPTVSDTGHLGYGANMNRATQIIHDLCDIVMPIEEDWELVREFDISGFVDVLSEPPEYSDDDIYCIRLGYLGWTNKVTGWLVQKARQTFFRFDESCQETHVFAGHPRIETVQFEKWVGAWPEGLRPGYTELEVCARPASRVGVAWPMDACINTSQDYSNLFAHIGEVQGG